jgi:Fibronectin type III domain
MTGSYEQILRERGALPVDDVVALGIVIGSALDAAHRNGRVHGDLRPATIRPAGGQAALEFGVGDPAGWSPHASPEALLGQAQSGLSDVYSLASSLWMLLAGHPPFLPPGGAPPDLAAFRDRVLHDELPPLRPDVPAWLTTELTRAMAKRPAQRHPSAGDFADALRRAGAPAPVPAAAPDAPAVVASLTPPRLVPATAPPTDPAPDPDQLDRAGWQGVGIAVVTEPVATLAPASRDRDTTDEPPPTEERSNRHQAGRVLLAAAAGLIVVAAAVSFALVATDRTGRPSPVATPSVITPVAAGAPGDVRLAEHGTTVTVSWTDPTDGTVEFLVTGAPVGGSALTLRNVARGTNSVTFGGLDPRADYCFVVAAVYAVDRVATAPRTCTAR